MRPPLHVSVDGDATFRIKGELDLATVPLLRDPLFEAIGNGATEIVVDLSECTLIDSRGVEVLALASWRLSANGGGKVALVCPRLGPARRTVDITGLDHILDVCDDHDHALETVTGR